MNRIETGAVNAAADVQHRAYEEACLHGRDTEAEVHWGMEQGLRLSIKVSKAARNAEAHQRQVARRARKRREEAP